MLKKLKFLLAVLSITGWAGSASASLLGQTVTCTSKDDVSGGELCNQPSAVVGPGEEFILQFGSTILWAVDVDDNSVNISNIFENENGTIDVTTQDFSLLLDQLFWSNDPSATITGIDNFMTDVDFGIDASDIVTGANSVNINYGRSVWGPGQFMSFDLVTDHSSPVPLPATQALLGLGLVGLGWFRSKKA